MVGVDADTTTQHKHIKKLQREIRTMWAMERLRHGRPRPGALTQDRQDWRIMPDLDSC